MGRNAPKRKTGKAVEALTRLPQELAIFRARAIGATVGEVTEAAYRADFAKVVRVGGSASYEGILRYLALSPDTAATKRSTLSGVYHQLRVQGTPLGPVEAEDLAFVVDGLECQEPIRPRRGAMDLQQFGQLLAECRARGRDWNEDYEALVVQFGLCCRGPSVMPVLVAGDFNEERKFVRCPRKARILVKHREGAYLAHPIYTEEAFTILKQRAALVRSDGLLFPRWSGQRISQLITYTADAYQWDTAKKWDGSHNVRHTAAMNTLEDALEEVRVRGGWTTLGSAAWYSRLER